MIRFTRAPLAVATETKAYLNSLPNLETTDGKELAEFLAKLPLYSIRTTTIEQLLSRDIVELLNELDRLAKLKEDAVAEQEFPLAKQHLNAERAVLAELSCLVPTPISIKPVHVVAILRTLGFDGDLPASE